MIDARCATRYDRLVIRNFRHKGLQRLYLSGETRGILPAHAKRLLARMERLDAERATPDELPAQWDCHVFKDELAGYLAVSISAQWRLVFRFEDGEFCDLDYVQYH
jgi:proteic killer suppression protein